MPKPPDEEDMDLEFNVEIDPDECRRKGMDPEKVLQAHRKHGRVGNVSRVGADQAATVRGK